LGPSEPNQRFDFFFKVWFDGHSDSPPSFGFLMFRQVYFADVVIYFLTVPDAAMYPKPEYDLQGWSIQHMACGNGHTVVSADTSSISWGSGTAYGELGFGADGPKSSAKPKKVDLLEGAAIGAVACGSAHTIWLAEASEVVASLPGFTPMPDSGEVPAQKGGKKQKAEEAEPKGGKKKAKK
jgi:hypothetical protein